MNSKIITYVFFVFVVLNPTLLFSEEAQMQSGNGGATQAIDEDQAIQEELRWLQAEAVVTIATKHETSISRTPGIVTVITAEEIREMGFRTLTDVLKIVPGFDISMDKGGMKNFAVRGILNSESPKVKVLIDGHSVNNPGSSGASWNFDDLVVENARRIEIVRGPGSALYGYNAFLAVINIITKDTVNIDPSTFGPLPTFTDFSEDQSIARRATRQIWSLYLQDEWNITDNIDLTVGVRYDHFKRFGSTTNPRFGLVWQFMEDAHLKLLFATAFRAPGFNEMFIENNPIWDGSPRLGPEKINTYEIGLGYNFTEKVSGNINCFYNRMRDRIMLGAGSPGQWFNNGGARIVGIEAEMKADLWDDNYFYANYTFQDAEDTRFRN